MAFENYPIRNERLWNSNFLLILAVNFLMFVGLQVLMPTLPVFAQSLGGSEASAGLVIGIFTVSAVLIRPITGRAVDIYGRKGIFIAGLILFILIVLVYSLVPSVLLLLILRFIHGFGWGSSSTAANTIASDIIPKSRLAEGIGYLGLTSTVSMALAPALGLYIMRAYSFKFVFLCSALAFICALVLALFIKYPEIYNTELDLKAEGKMNLIKAVLDASANRQSSGKTGSPNRYVNHDDVEAGIRRGLFEPLAYRASLIILFLTMTYGAIIAFIALYAAHRGIENIGPFFTIYAMALILTRPVFGRLADQKGYTIAVLPGIFGIIMTMLILYKADTLTMFLIAGFVYGLGFGAAMPALQAMSVAKVPPYRRGAANGTFFTGFDLGIGLGSILLGAVAQAVGYSQMYLWAVLPVLMALVIFLFDRNGDRAKVS